MHACEGPTAEAKSSADAPLCLPLRLCAHVGRVILCRGRLARFLDAHHRVLQAKRRNPSKRCRSVPGQQSARRFNSRTGWSLVSFCSCRSPSSRTYSICSRAAQNAVRIKRKRSSAATPGGIWALHWAQAQAQHRTLLLWSSRCRCAALSASKASRASGDGFLSGCTLSERLRNARLSALHGEDSGRHPRCVSARRGCA